MLDRVGQIGVLDVDLDDIEQSVVEECLDENCLQYAEIKIGLTPYSIR